MIKYTFLALFALLSTAHADEKMTSDDFQKSRIIQLEDQKDGLEKQVIQLQAQLQVCYGNPQQEIRNRERAELMKKYKLGEKDVIDSTGKIVRAGGGHKEVKVAANKPPEAAKADDKVKK